MSERTVKEMTEQAGNEALLFAAGSQSVETLRRLFGPTVAVSISQCRNGGYVVMTGNVIHAACTSPWEAKEIAGELMAGEFQVSVTKPEEARNVTPPEDHQGERVPGFLRPVPSSASAAETEIRERTAEMERNIAARMAETARVVVLALIVGLHAVVGA